MFKNYIHSLSREIKVYLSVDEITREATGKSAIKSHVGFEEDFPFLLRTNSTLSVIKPYHDRLYFGSTSSQWVSFIYLFTRDSARSPIFPFPLQCKCELASGLMFVCSSLLRFSGRI